MNKQTSFLFSLLTQAGLNAEEVESISSTIMDADGTRLDMRSATVQRALFAVPEFKEALLDGVQSILDARAARNGSGVVQVEIVNPEAVAKKKRK